ncbi:MucR family transcriptional regulator [Pseudaminobacter sp. 19-2017]|uniref:MucR family transcriptional regulator n=1 Tax=Pseudaminobacter soli (ex Zhang et al. 2022) TaxID=2831468 RepID=A0A942ECD5_9HYPH|nr:MucR family transcriptional regulator [Pseudaminobacter soli]
MSPNERNEDLVRLTSDVVSAYISNNAVPHSSLPSLISEVHASLTRLGAAPQEAVEEPKKPAVPIKKSVTDDYIVCLEDGKKFKSLKRHLSTHYGVTPDEYRAKWGLPSDYPMVAPGYAAARSALAKSMGLGRKRAPEVKPAKAKRTRKA